MSSEQQQLQELFCKVEKHIAESADFSKDDIDHLKEAIAIIRMSKLLFKIAKWLVVLIGGLTTFLVSIKTLLALSKEMLK